RMQCAPTGVCTSLGRTPRAGSAEPGEIHSMDVVIVDYGAGNLHSVAKAVEKTGFRALVSARPEDLLQARALILPGVGAAADTMRNLNACGMVEPVKQYIASGRPFLGVCMGLQALMTVSEEGGEHRCLDVVPGRVKKLA